MPSPRTWYLIAGTILAAGAIAAAAIQAWVSLVVFGLASALAFVLAARIDAWVRARQRQPDDPNDQTIKRS